MPGIFQFEDEFGDPTVASTTSALGRRAILDAAREIRIEDGREFSAKNGDLVTPKTRKPKKVKAAKVKKTKAATPPWARVDLDALARDVADLRAVEAARPSDLFDPQQRALLQASADRVGLPIDDYLKASYATESQHPVVSGGAPSFATGDSDPEGRKLNWMMRGQEGPHPGPKATARECARIREWALSRHMQNSATVVGLRRIGGK